jgi:hypothetical protein
MMGAGVGAAPGLATLGFDAASGRSLGDDSLLQMPPNDPSRYHPDVNRLVPGPNYNPIRVKPNMPAQRSAPGGSQETFLPLSHPPGEAQVDFGYADVDLAGERTQVALFVMTLPFSDASSCRPFRGNARRPFRKATAVLLTTAAGRSPRSPATESASSRASSCGSRATISSKRTSVWCGGPIRRGRSKAWSASPAATSSCLCHDSTRSNTKATSVSVFDLGPDDRILRGHTGLMISAG